MSSFELYQYSNISDSNNQEVSPVKFEEMMDTYVPGFQEEGIFATDMDGTMFRNDLGIQVFLEMLAESHEWRFGTEQFRKLLVPKSYKSIINLALHDGVKGVTPGEAQRFLDLRDDCTDLYEAIRKRQQDEDLCLEHPLVNEFARKMLALDALAMDLERVFVLAMEGQIFSRTRFFVGKNVHAVRKMTKAAIKDAAVGSGIVRLGVHEGNAEHYGQRIPASELEDIDYRKRIQVVQGIRHLIDYSLDREVPVRLVSTNNRATILGALEAIPEFNRILEQDCNGKKPFVGTELKEHENGELGAEMGKRAVFGPMKPALCMKLERRISAEHGKDRRTKLVAGDSPTNDGLMAEYALKNKGLVAFVAREGESPREAHDRMERWIRGDEGIEKRVGDPHATERLLILIDKGPK